MYRSLYDPPAALQGIASTHQERIAVYFAGGGGSCTGFVMGLGRSPDYAVNHNRTALGMHRSNHPETWQRCEDVHHVPPRECPNTYAAWFSPDCTHFSKAKGGTPVDKRIRGLILVMLRWAKAKTKVMFMENVEEITTWGPLIKMWKKNQWGWYPDPAHRGRTWQAFLAAMRGGLAPDHPDMLFMIEALAGMDIEEVAVNMRRPVTDPAVMTFLERKAEVSRKDLIKGFGYEVDYKELKAYEYGVPTTRKRLYGIFRRDKRPIVWPKATHANPAHLKPGDERQPWNTIAQCLDFTLPCPSIFLTRQEAKVFGCKRPLVENTLRRTAHGIGRYVLHAAKPFIINLTHHGAERVEDINAPINTITGAQRGEKGLVTATLTEHANSSNQRTFDVDEPMRTQCAEVKGGHFSLISGALVHTAHGEKDKQGKHRRGRGARSFEEPAPAATTSNDGAVMQTTLAPIAVTVGYGEREGQAPRVNSVEQPMNTIVTGSGKTGLAAVAMTKMRGTNIGGGADKPLDTVTASGQHHGVLAATVIRQFGESVGQTCDAPAPAIMPDGGGKTGILAATIVQQNGGHNVVPARAADSPLSAITTTGSQQNLAEIRLAHMDVYYGSEADGQPMDEPVATARTTSHMGPVQTTAVFPPLTEEQLKGARRVAAFLRHYGVEFEGEFATVGDYVLIDIGMRMLTPRELYRAQGFPEDYVIDYATLWNEKTQQMELRRLTKTEQIRMCGNAVCPGVAAAIIEANLPELIVKKNPAPWRTAWLQTRQKAA